MNPAPRKNLIRSSSLITNRVRPDSETFEDADEATPIANKMQQPLGNKTGGPSNQSAAASNFGQGQTLRATNGVPNGAARQNGPSIEKRIPPSSSENKPQGAIPKCAGRGRGRGRGRGVPGDIQKRLQSLQLSTQSQMPAALNTQRHVVGLAEDSRQPTASHSSISLPGGSLANRKVSGNAQQPNQEGIFPKYAGRKAIIGGKLNYGVGGDFMPTWNQLNAATAKPALQHSTENGQTAQGPSESVSRKDDNQTEVVREDKSSNAQLSASQSKGTTPTIQQNNTLGESSGGAQQRDIAIPFANQSQGAIPKITRRYVGGDSKADCKSFNEAQQYTSDQRDAYTVSEIPFRGIIPKDLDAGRKSVNGKTEIPMNNKSLNPNAPEFFSTSPDTDGMQDNWKDEYSIQPTIVYEFDELGELCRKLDKDGLIRCNVMVPDAIKRTKYPLSIRIVGMANLIPSEDVLFTIFGRKSINAFHDFVTHDNTTRQMLEIFNRKCLPILVKKIHEPDYYTQLIYHAIEKLITRLGVSPNYPKFIQFYKIVENFLNDSKSLFRECLRGELNHILLDDWIDSIKYLGEDSQESSNQEMKERNTFFTDQHRDDPRKWFYDRIEVCLTINTRRDIYGSLPCWMFTDIQNPFPLNVAVNSRGNIIYHFKFDMFIELTRDMGIRMSYPDFGIYVAISAFGSNISVLHPQGRVCKKKGAFHIQSFNKGVYRYAKITKDDELLFTKSNTTNIFELSEYELEKTNRQGNVRCLTTDDTIDIMQSEGEVGPHIADTNMIVAFNAKYEHSVKNDNIILGTVKIVQMPNGTLSLYRDNKHFHIQIMPGAGICQVLTPDYKVRADSNPRSVNFMVKKDYNRVLIHQNKFIVRRHELSAGFDEENCLKNGFSYPGSDPYY